VNNNSPNISNNKVSGDNSFCATINNNSDDNNTKTNMTEKYNAIDSADNKTKTNTTVNRNTTDKDNTVGIIKGRVLRSGNSSNKYIGANLNNIYNITTTNTTNKLKKAGSEKEKNK
jgi:hypothetical protein